MGPALRLPLISPTAVAAIGGLGALAVGAAMTQRIGLGLGLAIAIVYVPLVFLNLALAIGVWVVIVFLAGFPGLAGAPTASSILLLLAWIGTLGSTRAPVRAMATRHARLIAAGLALIAWFALTLAWAEDPGLAGDSLLAVAIALVTLTIVATTVSSRRAVRLIAFAFVAGAVLAVVLAQAIQGIHPAASAVATASIDDARLQSGASDPNYLAAVVVGALVLAGGLAAFEGRARVRLTLAAAALILLYGLLATQSRGGFIAAAAALLCALAIFRSGRGRVLLGILVVCAFAAVFFALNPLVLERVTTIDGGGNGRAQLWDVAWRVARDHPIAGVGIGNFVAVERDYVREAKPLRFSDLIAEQPHVVHNEYLQTLAETGVVGLVLLVALIVGLLRTFLLAAKRFDELGDGAMATLARALFVALIGMLSASFFLSNGTDRRYWILFALGPAMLSVAARDGHAIGAPDPATASSPRGARA
jgi:O-antigen ligase